MTAITDMAERINVAQGKGPVDLLLKNGRLVNVFSGEIHPASVAILGDRIIGFGDYDARETVDLQGQFLAPGFIDGHLHLESSMLAVPEFARNVAPLGTTSVVADPHEIANVLGVDGIRYMLSSSEGLPLRVFLMFPSCVPATPFETSGAQLFHADMEPFKDNDRILGLAEMMNFPGVLFADPEILAKIQVFKDKVRDGHAPGLSGKGLCAYVGAGIGSDHECTTLDEAREKLRLGMRIMIREGSAAKNMDALLPLVNEFNSRNCFFVTDDMDPADIVEHGHINRLVRKAIGKGIDPVRAIQMATINPASYFRLRDLGALAPRYLADIIVLEDLEQFRPVRVYHGGRLVAEDGKCLLDLPIPRDARVSGTMHVDWDKVRDFAIVAEGSRVNIIQAVPDEIVTRRGYEDAKVQDGLVVADSARDILKIAVIERHHGSGAFSVGLIRGFGLREGAISCSVAHDAHNIIVVGANDGDMMTAAKRVAAIGGGMAVTKDGEVLAELPFPIAGLMSDKPLEEVRTNLHQVVDAARGLGCALKAPFATLSFMALTPIPELKLTDQGLFDSVNFRFVSLFQDY
ncbi:MAG: adenine deaminase [Thermodesulfobacteriota bacterium]